MQATLNIQGHCDPRFRAVEDAFRENFETFGEVGASISVVVDGEAVVDLWGGHMDPARTKPWERDTIVNVWSTTKGITATCIHQLADRGLLDLDAPVAKYWPEFAQAGKEALPVRYLLSHQAGLPAIRKPLPVGSAGEWDVMTEALAGQEPWWEPGTKHGYHAFTYGWLLGEVLRRITGETIGAYFRKQIAEPLGLDFHIGLEPEHDARTAEIIPPEMPPLGEDNFLMRMLRDSESMAFKAIGNPPDLMNFANANTREWRAAEIPAANGHGTARSIARLYGVLARDSELDGVRMLSPQAIARAIEVQATGPDAVMGLPLHMALGWVVSSPEAPLGPNPRAFGHGGAGGSLGFADLDARVGFGYAMNKMVQTDGLVDPRWPSLIDAVYSSL
jgi:CubicO group peptidase (beta-lactamase class C family)